ncbi:hypothetical protein, partial [Mycobacteroides abscessus]|uniref:hypothetical protein n=1 Tax=Mycobacteroides abscessus TaxID=36809 RepID=UPI001A95B505
AIAVGRIATHQDLPGDPGSTGGSGRLSDHATAGLAGVCCRKFCGRVRLRARLVSNSLREKKNQRRLTAVGGNHAQLGA